MARSFKLALFLSILALSSCATQKRCAEKFPFIPYDTIYSEKIIYKDTIVYVTIPADTIIDSVKVLLPYPEAQGFKSDTAKVVSKYAGAMSWVADNSLKIRLNVYEQIIAFELDSAIKVNTKTITVIEKQIERVKYVPVIYKASLFINIILILMFILGIYLSLRR